MIIFLILVSFLLIPSFSVAGTDIKSKKVYKTEMDFSEENVEGQAKSPQGFFLRGKSKNNIYSMIHLRSNFKEKITKSSREVLIKN